MEEKYMVNDILEGSKNSLKSYENAIVESDNTRSKISASCKQQFSHGTYRYTDGKPPK